MPTLHTLLFQKVQEEFQSHQCIKTTSSNPSGKTDALFEETIHKNNGVDLTASTFFPLTVSASYHQSDRSGITIHIINN